MMDKSKLENKVDESSSGQQNQWRTETFKDKRLNKNLLNPRIFTLENLGHMADLYLYATLYNYNTNFFINILFIKCFIYDP